MKSLMWIVILVVLAGGGYWLWQGAQAPAVSDDGTPAADNAPSGTTSAMPVPGSGVNNVDEMIVGTSAMSVTVTYDGKAFSPSKVTVKKGGTVTFEDTAGSDMWVASAQHPSHTGYDGTSRSEHCASGYSGTKPFDQCGTGPTYSFTFDTVGSWPYHDHVNASAYGSVVVEQ